MRKTSRNSFGEPIVYSFTLRQHVAFSTIAHFRRNASLRCLKSSLLAIHPPRSSTRCINLFYGNQSLVVAMKTQKIWLCYSSRLLDRLSSCLIHFPPPLW